METMFPTNDPTHSSQPQSEGTQDQSALRTGLREKGQSLPLRLTL